MNLIVLLNEEQSFLESFLLHRSPKSGTEYLNLFLGKTYYRDINLLYVNDKQIKQWFTSGPEFFNEAICEKVRNKKFNLKAFGLQYYHVENRGNGYAIGYLHQRKALGNKAYLMPIIFDINDIWIAPNEIFYTTANAAQMRGKTFLTQDGIKYVGTYTLNVNEQKQLRSMLPNFQLKVFQKWMKVKVSDQQYQNELTFYPYNYYGSFGQVGYPVIGFQAVSQSTQKYKEWLGTDNRIFMKPYIRKIPKLLTDCEKLFDKDVLEIKQLVKDIGDLNNLIHKEQKNFILYDESGFIKETFFSELSQNIQSYGIISLHYDYNKKTLINWKNKLGFNINKNIKKEFITLQLEEDLAPEKIKTEDSKMTNISILTVSQLKKK